MNHTRPIRRTRPLLALVAALLIGLLVSPLAAQENTWSAWIYEVETGAMHRIGADGLRESFVLPLPDGYDRRPIYSVAVASNGLFMAYPVYSSAANAQALAIYNHSTGTIIATYAPGTLTYSSLEFSTADAFSADSTALAYGYGFDTGDWEMAVIDLATLSLRGALRSTDAAASGLPSGFGLVPTPVHFRPDNRVAFVMVPAGSDAFTFDSYFWNLDAALVEPTTGYSALGGDVLPGTGEVITATSDDRLPSRPDLFPMIHINSLHVFDPATGGRFPFYAPAPDKAVYAPRFVGDGSLIAALEADGSGISAELVLLTRDHPAAPATTRLPTPGYVSEMAGTPDGVIYVAAIAGEVPTLRHIPVTPDFVSGMVAGAIPGADQPLWTATAPNTLRIAWAGLLGQSDIQTAAFARWTQLAAPLSAAGFESAMPPGIEQVEVLTPGGVATIRTTDGDQLNMRSGAGTQFAIVEKLPSGTRVDVLEGPVIDADYTWWRVRAPGGNTGWVVEYADNEQTLVAGTSLLVGEGGELDEREAGSPDPSLASLLTVGEDALVTLTARRDALRLRNAPGLEARVIVLLSNGTRVRVVDGPRQVDGFTWWQVRTPEGNAGWAAEIVAGERTLNPAP